MYACETVCVCASREGDMLHLFINNKNRANDHVILHLVQHILSPLDASSVKYS